MARLFLSNCHRSDRGMSGAARLLLPLLLVTLGACASLRGDDAAEWPEGNDNVAGHYLLGLREYLAKPAGKQAVHREQLRVAAERGNPAAMLEYAFALSVDRDDRESLERARALFESLLVAPDPLPVALDALTRLQLGQVIDRLERMRANDELNLAVRIGANELKTCLVRLDETEIQREDMRKQLAEVRRKLDALTRIEQTVNHGQDTNDDQQNQENRENEDAERQPDTARR
ncbi:MAG TPA: hypothetical protein VF275_01045 [Gammaproteobacteria bacterium]